MSDPPPPAPPDAALALASVRSSGSSSPRSPSDEQPPDALDAGDPPSAGLSLNERFVHLQSLIGLQPTLFENRSINCELLFDVLNCLHYESHR